jgi:hypothetical protein
LFSLDKKKLERDSKEHYPRTGYARRETSTSEVSKLKMSRINKIHRRKKRMGSCRITQKQ